MPPKVGQRATKDDMSRHGMGNTAAGKYGGTSSSGASKKGSVTGGKTNSQRESGKHTEVK